MPMGLSCVAVCFAFAAVDDALLRVVGFSKGGVVMVHALCLRGGTREEEEEGNASGRLEGDGSRSSLLRSSSPTGTSKLSWIISQVPSGPSDGQQC
jgi:hypothetical protein